MNKENILKVANAIETGALIKRGIGFNMASFVASTSTRTFAYGLLTDHIDNCGTTCCIAGWAYALHHPEEATIDPELVRDDATEWLGLSGDDSWELFYAPDIEELDQIKPAAAVAVLRHLAETGKVDWSVALPVQPVTEG